MTSLTSSDLASPDLASPWQPLFERLLAELDCRASPDWQAATATLDPRIYHDPDRFTVERERLFRRQPLCLGHADQLAEPGSVLALELCGVPVLLTRGRDGELGAFLNVCRHRGARLLTEEGTVCRKQALACPYHAWTYRLDGTLAGVSRAEAFPDLDRARLGLRRLPCAVRHGLIWVVLDPDADPALDIAGHLGDLDGDLQATCLAKHRFYRQHAVRRATNWKLIVDAFLEVYHVRRLHAGTIGGFFPDAVAVNDSIGRHVRSLIARDNVIEIRSLPPQQWSPQVHATLVHFIFPNSVFIYHPDYVSHLGLFPSAPDETLFIHTMLTPHEPADAKAEAHWARSFELIDSGVFNQEDLVVCEQIQRGLASGANDALIIGRLEHNLHRFHSAVDTALR
jgi:phenylpropionate dioxygenase-like ring-hydroxylating dioxygenase large terminal subunit